MTILIIAEHDNKHLRQSTLNTVTAAQQVGGDIHLAVFGSSIAGVATEAAAVAGVAKVLSFDDASLAEQGSEALSANVLSVASAYTHILAPATSIGKSVLPRVAAKLDVAQISDIIKVESADTFVRPIYAGNVLATVQSIDPIKVITVRTTCFDAAVATGGSAVVEAQAVQTVAQAATFVSRELAQSARPDLTAASIVVSGGRGVGSADNFKIIEALADKLGAAMGASRAAVDAGFVPNDLQVGQTGKIVAPQLYVAVGISGAIQHQAGMKDSKIIVAINKNPDEPIFQIADYGIVGDLFEVVPQLTAAL
ncbi:electron transfer flavoprotein subunit alpha/FixB family protein [Hydromonas duriensis]|uniref:Electron transfer flavoprotein subunit alpha n=1 Tax=Hydromonas duriensis TaxID=1527608 RepID=A0A4R6YA01_9BURK|nr:electron transfer flavoprotein subunit alpha/FixB family protein [Hydromonas duriensis]TDR32341.1 electron transfer flavoprotein alpha subunit apoprotein [Hydromonas duriensis]